MDKENNMKTDTSISGINKCTKCDRPISPLPSFVAGGENLCNRHRVGLRVSQIASEKRNGVPCEHVYKSARDYESIVVEKPRCKCGEPWDIKERITYVANCADLTPRESEVFYLLMKGLSSTEIAALLSIAVSTVKRMLVNILSKFNVRSRVKLVGVVFTF